MSGVVEDNINADDLTGEPAEIFRVLKEPIGKEKALKAAVVLAKEYSGQHPYFGKYEAITRPARDRAIRRDFKGNNIRGLIRKYNLSDVRIRNILADKET